MVKFSKKIAALLLSVFMAVSVPAGCSSTNQDSSGSQPQEGSSSQAMENEGGSASSNQAPQEKTNIKIACLKGPTGLGMLKLMEDGEKGEAINEYEFTLVGDPTEIVSKISAGEVDVAAVPTNLAATLYNKTEGNVQIAALNTLGVLYLITSGENIPDVKSLAGKTLYASGQGSTAEYALNYILEANDLTVGQNIQVEYKAEHTELATLLISGGIKLAVLPEPFVTQVTAKNPDLKVALNLTEEWNKAVETTGDAESVLTMGCLIVRKEFAKENKEAFERFMQEYQASVDYTNTQLEAAAVLSEKFDIMPAAVAQKAIPNCNIVFISGEELQQKASGFLNILFKANPKSVGGKMPGEDFYYGG